MAEPVLAVEGLVKRFGALPATDGVSLDLRAGEIHALIGPNGAGKSTLIRQIVGELRPDAGTIRFGGRDIGGLGMAERARLGLARSFQVSSVIPGFTAAENVMLAAAGAAGRVWRFLGRAVRDPALVAEAGRCLAAVGLAARAGIRAADLAHGERRQLEIAMALALRPRLFLLDEPMAGMDPEGAKALVGFLGELKRRAPILLVEHDMDAVFALADRISVLVYGRIIARGSAAEIRADPAVRAAYLGEEGG